MIVKRDLANRVRSILILSKDDAAVAIHPQARELLSECAIVLELQNESEELMLKIVDGIIPALASRIAPPPEPSYSPEEDMLLFKSWIRSVTADQLDNLKEHLTAEQFRSLRDARELVLTEDR